MEATAGARVLEEERLRRLIAVGRSLVSELDPEAVLDRVLDAARDLTGARYAALGILDERHEEVERFLFRGNDEELQGAIGARFPADERLRARQVKAEEVAAVAGHLVILTRLGMRWVVTG